MDDMGGHMIDDCDGYEPGDETHPMHTDPLCKHCGGPKSYHR